MISCEQRFDNFSKMPIYNLTITVLWILIIIQAIFNILHSNTFILVGLAALLASASVMKNIANTNIIEQEKIKREESQFFLETSLKEIKNVYDLLKDKNNNRSTWILAARVLKNALAISKKISLDSHKEVYKLKELQIKHILTKLFESKEYENLAFFAGLDKKIDYKENQVISKLYHSTSAILCLDEDSVFTIFSFLEYPDDFKDPLNEGDYPTTSKEIQTWRRKGGGLEFKKTASKYLDIQLNENNKYQKDAYEGTTL